MTRRTAPRGAGRAARPSGPHGHRLSRRWPRSGRSSIERVSGWCRASSVSARSIVGVLFQSRGRRTASGRPAARGSEGGLHEVDARCSRARFSVLALAYFGVQVCPTRSWTCRWSVRDGHRPDAGAAQQVRGDRVGVHGRLTRAVKRHCSSARRSPPVGAVGSLQYSSHIGPDSSNLRPSSTDPGPQAVVRERQVVVCAEADVVVATSTAGRVTVARRLRQPGTTPSTGKPAARSKLPSSRIV